MKNLLVLERSMNMNRTVPTHVRVLYRFDLKVSYTIPGQISRYPNLNSDLDNLYIGSHLVFLIGYVWCNLFYNHWDSVLYSVRQLHYWKIANCKKKIITTSNNVSWACRVYREHNTSFGRLLYVVWMSKRRLMNTTCSWDDFWMSFEPCEYQKDVSGACRVYWEKKKK